MTAKRRILSIDGGGIKGVLPAAFLATIEDATGKRIAEHFDLIVGTSTGGITALGLGLGMSAKQLLDLYVNDGPTIFGRASASSCSALDRLSMWCRSILNSARHKMMPKYDPAQLRVTLEREFGERSLGQSSTRLVIPAYHSDRRDVYVFKTAHHPRFELDWKVRAVDVALATAAAPTYFPAHLVKNGAVLVDGGVWANNPVGIAVVEAVAVLEWPADSLYVLSIGCTESTYAIPSKPGQIDLAFTQAEIFLQGQSKGAVGMAKLLTRHSESNKRLFRYQPSVEHNAFALDGVEHINRLRSLGAAEARHALPDLKEIFFSEPVDIFQPRYARQPHAA